MGFDEKPWYASRTIWGGVAAIIGGAGLLVGIEFDVTHVQALTDALLQAGTIIGGIVAVWGRMVARKRIE